MAEGQRRLAAIMFTDIVGYTSLAQSNEALALQMLEKHDSLLRPLFSKYEGEEIKTVGDSFLVEFGSALSATNCAVEIQKSLRDYNSSCPHDLRIKVRIGIHLGDVVHRQADIFGDAVNIASRIEPLAEPEGICISSQVFDQVRNKLEYQFAKLERPALKNVSIPIGVYKVVMPWDGSSTLTSNFSTSRIAVLPFANISPDPNDEYFADGLTEELIDRLCQLSQLEVIARTSIMNYKRKEKNVSDIGKELKIGSVVEGSVRKVGNRVRVTAQLVNCNTETHLWSSRYDRNLDDIFAVQSDIAENVVSALKVKLLDQEKNALQHKGPKNSEAYVEYLRGVHFRHKQPVELNFRKAVEHLEKAVQLEPNYAEAFALLGEAWGNLAYFGYEPRDKANAKARQLVSKALELDDTIPEAHCSRASEAYFIEGNLTKADEELRRAIELNPNNLDAHLRYAILLSSLGCNNEAIIEIEKCLRLDPVSAGVHNIAGPIYFFAGRIAEALDHHRTAAELEPVSGHTNLGITLLDIGSTEEGVKELEIALKQGGSSFFKGNLGCAYAISGRKEDAQRILNDIKADTNRAPRSYALANIYACLGEKEEALDWLERAYEDRSIYTFPLLHIEPFLANLREEPRFKELVRKMGLEKYQTGPTIK